MKWGRSLLLEKISDLRGSLDATKNLCSTVNCHSSHCSYVLYCFALLYMDSLRKLVLRAPTKSCLLDPVRTNILKDCLDELLPILATTINLWLESGFFPDICKDSVLTQLLKKKVLTWFLKTFYQSAIFPLFQNWLKECQLIRFSPT